MTDTITEAEFFEGRDDRRTSGELDFGVWWKEHGQWEPWRVSWVTKTGELYAVKLGGDWPDPKDKTLVILGVFQERDRVEGALEGWAEVCGEDGSLDWIRERVAGKSESMQ